MLCARFDHMVSRNQDPQLHSHCVILNKTMREDGSIRSLEPQEIFKNTIILGQKYRNYLSKNLIEKGYKIKITDKKKGFFEIDGIPANTLKEFSSRREELLKYLKDNNLNSNNPKLNQAIILKTRKAKENVDFELLKESWKMEFKTLGIDRLNLKNTRNSLISEKKKNDFFDMIDKKISNETVAFEKKMYSDLSLKEGLKLGITHNDINNRLDSKMDELYFNCTINGIEYIATKEALIIENNIYDSVKKGKNSKSNINADVLKEYSKYLENLTITQKNFAQSEISKELSDISNF
jgi:hypothetical protein